jgi:transposase InsO family protein
MDFFAVPTVTFQLVYVWFAIDHARRRILHVDATDQPTAAWVVQQLRETFRLDVMPRHLIFDRDSIFSAQVVSTVKSFGIAPKRTPYRSPWQNGVAERWVGSVRRELLDHLQCVRPASQNFLLPEDAWITGTLVSVAPQVRCDLGHRCELEGLVQQSLELVTRSH